MSNIFALYATHTHDKLIKNNPEQNKFTYSSSE